MLSEALNQALKVDATEASRLVLWSYQSLWDRLVIGTCQEKSRG
jgi:16S rRNA C1402 N4-methylase RsmH